MASLSGGRFVVTSTGGDGIFGQLYDSSGNTAGNEFQINTYTTDNQNSPSVTSLNDGGFVVTWISDKHDQNDGGSGIFGQRYDANGDRANSGPKLTTVSALNMNEDAASSAIAFSATDVDGDTLAYSFSTPSKGSVTNNGNGTYTYTPDAN